MKLPIRFVLFSIAAAFLVTILVGGCGKPADPPAPKSEAKNYRPTLTKEEAANLKGLHAVVKSSALDNPNSPWIFLSTEPLGGVDTGSLVGYSVDADGWLTWHEQRLFWNVTEALIPVGGKRRMFHFENGSLELLLVGEGDRGTEVESLITLKKIGKVTDLPNPRDQWNARRLEAHRRLVAAAQANGYAWRPESIRPKPDVALGRQAELSHRFIEVLELFAEKSEVLDAYLKPQDIKVVTFERSLKFQDASVPFKWINPLGFPAISISTELTEKRADVEAALENGTLVP